MTINALTSLGRAVIGFVAFFSLVHLSGFAGQNPADENAIRNVVEGYLKAKNWKERLVFVQDPGKQEAAMQKKYQGAEFQLQTSSPCNWMRPMKLHRILSLAKFTSLGT